jgi:hypothetical protein
MQHLEVSGAVVLYIGRTVSKGWAEIRFGLRTAEPVDQTQIIRVRFVKNVVILKPLSLLWGARGLLNGKKV